MSRQRWRQASSTRGYAVSDWRAAFSHTRMEGRTTDPEALDWDEAVDIFLNGLRCARQGDLDAGRAQIAAAFLLDGRSINFCAVLPAPDAAELALDCTLLSQLISSDLHSLASSVLTILATTHNFHLEEFGQDMIGGAMKAIEKLIQACEQNPQFEKSADEGGLLGGCLTRPTLLFHRSSLHMAMGNHKLAIRDLTAALKIDPKYTPARDARANLYVNFNLKDRSTAHAEFKRVISEVHADHRANEVSYAWLSITTLQDAKLGTLDDAKRYYEQSIRATERRAELYGPRTKENEPPVLDMLKQRMAELRSTVNAEKLRRELDRAVRVGSMDGINIPDGFVMMEDVGPDKGMRHVCLSCDKSAKDKGLSKLLKCGRCQQVHYCSKECQTRDWKNHKSFCKQLSAKAPPEPAPPPPDKTATQRDSVAKTPIDELSGQARACVRMQDELRRLNSNYGPMFSDWWHKKTVQQKKDTLLHVTNNTIPPKMPTDADIQRDTRTSRCLPECNLEVLTGTCGCSTEACEHIYTDRVLHEIFIRALHPESANSFDTAVCQQLMSTSVLPVMFESLAFILPQEDGPKKYDLQMVKITDNMPRAEIQKTKDLIQEGVLRDANQATYVLIRQLFSLGLLVKLFDTYQVEVRRCLAQNPYERLMGCLACHQTCEGHEALKCDVCRAFWWCCHGCKMATDHGRKCPIGKPCESRALFN